MSFCKKKTIKCSENSREILEDDVAVEAFLTIYINKLEYSTVVASPSEIYELVAGILLGEEIIKQREDIIDYRYDNLDQLVFITVNEERAKLAKQAPPQVRLTGCARSASTNYLKKVCDIKPVTHNLTLSTESIYKTMSLFSRKSELFSKTGGVHSAALVDGTDIIAFFEDISRHNTIDKLLGYAMLKEISLDGKWVATSGRISSDLIFKLAMAKIPIAVSRKAPTSKAIELADMLNITAVGFVRGRRLNIYTCANRITQPGQNNE